MNNKIIPPGKVVANYVMNDMNWKVDVPAFLDEIATSSMHAPYKVTFNILKKCLCVLAQRAIELNDPALNIIMLNLSLYDGSHDQNVRKIKEHERTRIMKSYTK